jgi:hypothetical protein
VTGNGVAVLVAGGVALGGWLLGYPGAAPVALLAAALLLVAAGWRVLAAGGGEIGLEVSPPTVHRGHRVTVSLSVRAGALRRRGGPVHATVTVLDAAATGTVTAGTWTQVATRRGRATSRVTAAARVGPLWLSGRRLGDTPPVQTTVLPRLHPFPALSPPAWVDDDGRASTKPGGPVFASLRDYVDGDDIRLIDWAASARTGDGSLVVRQKVLARTRLFRLVLDPDPGTGAPEDFETAVDVAYSVAHAVHRMVGHRPAFTTVVDGRVVAPVGLAAIGTVLAEVSACPVPGCLATLLRPAVRHRGLTTVVVTTGSGVPLPLSRAAGPSVLLRVGGAAAAGRAQRVGRAAVFDVPDLAAAAVAWEMVVRP